MRTYSYTVNGARYDVTIESLRDQVAKLNVNGVAFDVEILGAPLTEGDLPEVAAWPVWACRTRIGGAHHCPQGDCAECDECGDFQAPQGCGASLHGRTPPESSRLPGLG